MKRNVVLVIREFDNFSRRLAENDFEIINLPLIQTVPIENLSDFDAKIEKLENCDGVFLTSAPATEIFRRRLREKNIAFGGKVYVFGKRSFDILQSENFDLIFFETASTAREMLERIARQDLTNKNFLFVCGEKSLRVVPEFLAKIAAIDEAIVYRTGKLAVESDTINEVRKKLKNGEITCACFFSPSGTASFAEQFGIEILHQTEIAAIGKTTAEFLERQNLKVNFVSPRATAEDFAGNLIEYLKGN